MLKANIILSIGKQANNGDSRMLLSKILPDTSIIDLNNIFKKRV